MRLIHVIAFFLIIIVGLDSCRNHVKFSKKQVITESQSLAKGQELFQNNCTACHNFLQKAIGPNLSELPSDIPSEYLKKIIQNAPQLIQSGDVRANQLFEDYKLMMPAFPQLSESELESIVEYIGANQKQKTPLADKGAFGPVVKDPIPQKIAQSGLRLLLEEVTTVPVTNTPPALARINTMRVLSIGYVERLFIADLQGIMYEIEEGKTKPRMDLRTMFPHFINKPGFGNGFGSFAFHPLFHENGLLYTTHTEKTKTATADFGYADSIRVAMQWVLTEWKIENASAEIFLGKNRELMRINVVSPIHGMQEIAFNPLAIQGSTDFGNLYIGIGDGGATENGYYGLCNDHKKIWSSLLRINPLGKNSKNGKYGIPDDNPFVKEPTSVAEVYSRGFRNPNRFSWTPDGKLLVSDIGHKNAEELNWVIKGADYGWPEREGAYLMNHRAEMDKVYNLPTNENITQYTYPVAYYDHDEGNAISGGYVYNGKNLPLLTNKYIFGDVVNGRVFYVENNLLKQGSQATIKEVEIQINGKLTSFKALNQDKKADLRIGEGPDHSLYFFTKTDGKIYKVSGCTLVN